MCHPQAVLRCKLRSSVQRTKVHKTYPMCKVNMPTGSCKLGLHSLSSEALFLARDTSRGAHTKLHQPPTKRTCETHGLPPILRLERGSALAAFFYAAASSAARARLSSSVLINSQTPTASSVSASSKLFPSLYRSSSFVRMQNVCAVDATMAGLDG